MRSATETKDTLPCSARDLLRLDRLRDTVTGHQTDIALLSSTTGLFSFLWIRGYPVPLIVHTVFGSSEHREVKLRMVMSL